MARRQSALTPGNVPYVSVTHFVVLLKLGATRPRSREYIFIFCYALNANYYLPAGCSVRCGSRRP